MRRVENLQHLKGYSTNYHLRLVSELDDWPQDSPHRLLGWLRVVYSYAAEIPRNPGSQYHFDIHDGLRSIYF